MLTKLSLTQLYNCKSHIGSSRDSYFKVMKDFILACKVDYFILNVIKTLLNLKLAVWFAFYIAVYSNKLLFIHHTTEPFIFAFGLVFRVLGHFTLKTKWRSGTLTNFRRIRKHYRYLYVKYIKDFQIYKKLTFFTYYNKKLAPQISDYLFIRRLPSFIVIISVFYSDIAVKESFAVRIPSTGFNNNKSLPFGLTYPVTSNDVSHLTLTYYLLLYKNSIYKGLFVRRTEFFTLFQQQLYYYSKIVKIHKTQIYLPFSEYLKNTFFVANLSKYKTNVLKYTKRYKKKVSYMLFVKYRRKRDFNLKRQYYFFRKEKKKKNYFLNILLSNFKLNFLKKNSVKITSYFLYRKIYFANIFFNQLNKKKIKFFKFIKKKNRFKNNKINKSIVFIKKNIFFPFSKNFINVKINKK